jgi:hypothetical protein
MLHKLVVLTLSAIALQGLSSCTPETNAPKPVSTTTEATQTSIKITGSSASSDLLKSLQTGATLN